MLSSLQAVGGKVAGGAFTGLVIGGLLGEMICLTSFGQVQPIVPNLLDPSSEAAQAHDAVLGKLGQWTSHCEKDLQIPFWTAMTLGAACGLGALIHNIRKKAENTAQ